MGGKPKAKLTPEAQAFAVQALACFDKPAAVAAAIREEFGVTITPQSVEAYDPTKRAGANIAQKWRLLFNETRETFLASTATIGISHRAVRLRLLDRMVGRAEAMGNMALAAQLLEQAAKEAGDAFTNRSKHEVVGKDGAPLSGLTDDSAVAAKVSALLAAAQARKDADAAG